MKNNIAVIGVGALGKRHLESILKTEMALDVYCIDVNPNALATFQFEDSYHNKKIISGTDVSILPESLDWVLFAMTSAGRREMFDAVVSHSKVRYVLFEKVLFQREDDYYHVGERLKSLSIKAWVNCARREQDCYQQLKADLDMCERFEVHVSGGDWGMACNAIHMLDLVRFLSGRGELRLESCNFEDKIAESKRTGYKEVFGVLSGSCGRCKNFTVSCYENSKLPLQIEIVTPLVRIQIEEGKGLLKIWDGADALQCEERPFILKYQSQLTQQSLESALLHDDCRLVSYEESMQLHLAFIRPLINFFSSKGMEKGICPIT